MTQTIKQMLILYRSSKREEGQLRRVSSNQDLLHNVNTFKMYWITLITTETAHIQASSGVREVEEYLSIGLFSIWRMKATRGEKIWLLIRKNRAPVTGLFLARTSNLNTYYNTVHALKEKQTPCRLSQFFCRTSSSNHSHKVLLLASYASGDFNRTNYLSNTEISISSLTSFSESRRRNGKKTKIFSLFLFCFCSNTERSASLHTISQKKKKDFLLFWMWL